VLRLLGATAILCAALAVNASAGAPKVTASVTKTSATERVVHITNHDTVAYRQFLVITAIKPAVFQSSCGIVERDGAFNGVKFNWKYTVTCKKTLPPGRAFDIQLRTSPQSGNLAVYVVVNKVRTRIG